MTSNISAKPAFAALPQNAAHPFEASVRQDIVALRGQLTQLRQSGSLDAFGKSQVKNLEAQLGKKNAYLASITPSLDKPVAAAAPDKVAKVAPRLAAKSTRPQAAAPEQSFGALGARLKGRLVADTGLQLSPGAPPEGVGF